MKHKLATFSNLALTVENVFLIILALHLISDPRKLVLFVPNCVCLFQFFSILIPKNTAYLFYVFFCIHFYNWVCKCSLKEMIMLYVVTVQSFGISNTFCSWFNGFCLRWLIGQTYSLPLPLQKHSWPKKKKKTSLSLRYTIATSISQPQKYFWSQL